MPGMLLASRVARLSEPWRSCSSCSRSMTFTWRAWGTSALDVREEVISMGASSTGVASAELTLGVAASPGTTMKVCSSCC
ncbi:hypothetical protein D9M72_606300 [compost metagenome]